MLLNRGRERRCARDYAARCCILLEFLRVNISCRTILEKRGYFSDRRMDVVTDCVSIINRKGVLSHIKFSVSLELMHPRLPIIFTSFIFRNLNMISFRFRNLGCKRASSCLIEIQDVTWEGQTCVTLHPVIVHFRW